MKDHVSLLVSQRSKVKLHSTFAFFLPCKRVNTPAIRHLWLKSHSYFAPEVASRRRFRSSSTNNDRSSSPQFLLDARRGFESRSFDVGNTWREIERIHHHGMFQSEGRALHSFRPNLPRVVRSPQLVRVVVTACSQSARDISDRHHFSLVGVASNISSP